MPSITAFLTGAATIACFAFTFWIGANWNLVGTIAEACR